MKQFPAWIFCPSGGVAPGHDWVPGPVLRAAIVLLVCGFLALALTVNYVASVVFFLLAILGIYIGLRRGFVNGLQRGERYILLVFGLYPTVALAAYLLGQQTNIGFRLLGRDLRFLLFIPVYVALRWSGVRRELVGWGLAAGSFGALISAGVAVIEHPPGFRPQGVTGVPITFGDLALLGGFVGASILVSLGGRQRVMGALIAIVAGLAASVFSGSRGGWIAVPLLIVLVGLSSRSMAGSRLGVLIAIVSILTVATLAVIPGGPIAVRGREAIANVRQYLYHWQGKKIPPSERTALCPNSYRFLSIVKQGITQATQGAPVPIRVVKDAEAFGNTPWARRCSSDYMLEVTKPLGSRYWTTLSIPRSPVASGIQLVGVLAYGSGMLRSAGGKILSFRTEKLRKVEATFRLPGLAHEPLLISLRPGDTLKFVPLQLQPGSYYFSYTSNALGLRLEMWRAAAVMFLSNPVIGVGTGAFKAHADLLVKQGRIAPAAGNFEHPHSDYLEALCEKGVPGILSLLAIFFIPWLAVRAKEPRGIGNVMVVFVAGWMLFSLSETLFIHSFAITWYALMTAILAALAFKSTVSGQELEE